MKEKFQFERHGNPMSLIEDGNNQRFPRKMIKNKIERPKK